MMHATTSSSFIPLAAHLRSIRVDGRSPSEPRPVRVSVRRGSHSRSQADVDLGVGVGMSTKAWCEVSGELVRPRPERPGEGILQVVVASSNPPRGLDAALNRAGAVDMESLCVVAGRMVWMVRAVVVVVCDGGAAVDAASIALMAALMHWRRNDVTVVGEDVTVHSLDDRVPLPLSILHVPLAVSMALLMPPPQQQQQQQRRDHPGDEDASHTSQLFMSLVDPTNKEEAVADGVVVMMLNAHKELCGFSKTGEPPLSPDELLGLVDVAVEVRRQRGQVLEKALLESPF